MSAYSRRQTWRMKLESRARSCQLVCVQFFLSLSEFIRNIKSPNLCVDGFWNWHVEIFYCAINATLIPPFHKPLITLSGIWRITKIVISDNLRFNSCIRNACRNFICIQSARDTAMVLPAARRKWRHQSTDRLQFPVEMNFDVLIQA